MPYRAKLDVIMGGEPFFLGMDNTEAYRRDTGAMRRSSCDRRISRSGWRRPSSGAREELVAEADGRIEVVDALVRRVTFEVLGDYFGVTAPAGAAICGFGPPGCSSSSSPTAATTRRCDARWM